MLFELTTKLNVCKTMVLNKSELLELTKKKLFSLQFLCIDFSLESRIILSPLHANISPKSFYIDLLRFPTSTSAITIFLAIITVLKTITLRLQIHHILYRVCCMELETSLNPCV